MSSTPFVSERADQKSIRHASAEADSSLDSRWWSQGCQIRDLKSVRYESHPEIEFNHAFHEDSPDKLSEAETFKTKFGAKTMGLDTKTHNLFLDTADFAPLPRQIGRTPGARRFKERLRVGVRAMTDLPVRGE